MGRRIEAEVDRNGQVKVEFSGFDGETCFEEAEVLRRALKELGLWAIPVSVVPKTSSQIEAEVGSRTPAEGRKVPLS